LNIIPHFIRRRIAHHPNLLKIVDNVGWLFFDRVLRIGVGLIVIVWLARYLGPERFGQLNYAIAFVGLFGVLATLGLQNIVVRDVVCEPSYTEETLGSAAILQIVSGLIAYCIIVSAITLFRSDDELVRALVAIIGMSVLFRASEIAMYWFESQIQSKYTVWVHNSIFFVFSILKLAFIMHSSSVIAFAWVTMLEAFITAIILLLVMNFYGPKLVKLKVSFNRIKGLISDCWPLLLSGVAITIYMRIDQIMIGQMVNDNEVGIYNAAIRVSEVWHFVPIMLVSSAFPAILQERKHSKELFYKRLQHLYDIMVCLSLTIALPMTFFSTPIVALLFGELYEPSGKVLAIHIWAAVFVFLIFINGKWFVAEKRQILNMQRTFLGAIINIVLNTIMIPKFGIEGAAWATVIALSIAGCFFDLVQKETRKIFLMKLKAFNLIRIFNNIKYYKRNYIYWID